MILAEMVRTEYQVPRDLLVYQTCQLIKPMPTTMLPSMDHSLKLGELKDHSI